MVPFLTGKNNHSRITTFLLQLVAFIASLNISYGQTPEPGIKVDHQSQFLPLEKFSFAFLPADFDLTSGYSDQLPLAAQEKSFMIPAANVSRKLIARFKVINNTGEPDSLYFFPGLHFRNVMLYTIENGKAIQLSPIAPQIEDSISFRLFNMLPNDTLSILAECYPLRTYNNTFKPTLVNPDYIKPFSLELQRQKKDITVFTYIFCGLLLMMVLFSLANFLQGGNREFLYYAAYAFFLGFMLFTKQFYYSRSHENNFFFEAYLDFVLQCLGIWFFMLFMIRFLETKRDFPFLHKLYMSGIILLPVVIVIYSFLHYSTINYFWENALENYFTKNVLLIMMVIFLVYAARNWHHKLLRYLFWGNLLYLFFALLSLVVVLRGQSIKFPGIFGDALVLYECGLLIELIFFLMGLTYKNRTQLIEQTKERERLKTENERKELEKQVAVMQAHQEERERISADIHDELGSGMTTIRLMSEIAKNKMKENIPVEIEKISNSANEVLNKMNAIIWSMNSSNDTLDSLISYIRAYAIEFFDNTPVDCRVNMPETIPYKELSGDKRRNIFLCVKETLNNTLKHSRGNKVNINISTNGELKIDITDNGVGIDPDKIRRFGNGLKNIERRMKGIGGNYRIMNNGGTETILNLPL
ncbi:MAG TPA: sensor histidine kinase [Chitinophagaceae bacterium]|nr:sensor histidine kinase [Chitinophagaceae bacterium]